MNFKKLLALQVFNKHKCNLFQSSSILSIRASLCICCVIYCLVPVRRFPSPSRSIRLGDVSEANGRETPSHFCVDHVTRNALAVRKNEA